MNVPRIKGSHNAMLSGMLAAEHLAAALAAGRANDELADYETAWRSSAIGPDLWKVRNAKPLWSRFGTFAGIALGGFDMWTNTLGFSLFGTLGHGKPDWRRSSRPRNARRSPIPNRTASSHSTACPRCFSPTPITRRTSPRT